MDDYSKSIIDDVELVVVKERALSEPSKGIVNIVCVRNRDDKTIRPVDRNIYASGGLWISNGYERIQENFRENEPFILEAHYPQGGIDNQEQVAGRHDHWAFGHNAKSMESNHIIPVLCASLPDRSTGRVDLPGNVFFSTGSIFILDKADCKSVYGPFKVNISDDGMTATPENPVSLRLAHNHVLKMELDKLTDKEIYVESPLYFLNTEGFIASLKLIGEKRDDSFSEVDCINDTQLIRYFWQNNFGRPRSDNPVTKKAAAALMDSIKKVQQRDQLFSETERLRRLESVLDKYLENKASDLEIINNYLMTEEGKIFLEGFAQRHPDMVAKYEQTFKEKTQEYKERLAELKRKVEKEEKTCENKIMAAKETARKKIEAISKKTEADTQKELRKRAAALEEDIAQKQARHDSLEHEINNLLGYRKKAVELAALDNEIIGLQETESKLKRAVKAQEKQLGNPDLTEEVTKLKTLLDVFHSKSTTEIKKPYIRSSMMKNRIPKDNGEQLIQSVCERFDESGRQFSFEETANLLISLRQSFLTVFKGLPGSGKTSTVIRLARALGLGTDDFLNVPVSRGWVSSRDLVGFYNSLKDYYQPAKTGVYPFLCNGSLAEARLPIRLILLDEANLSPVEHYWSDFIAMCDSESRHRPLDTGIPDTQQSQLVVEDNIRFIATVNNDNTTEPLSPRLCDRACIISMDAPYMVTESDVQPLTLDGAVYYQDFENLFAPVNEAMEEPEVIFNFCEKMTQKNKELGSTIMVSRRKINSMVNYYSTASQYIDSTCAADFALSQHALPLINGYGKLFKNRLEELKKYTVDNGLSRTGDLLDSIISSGDAYVESYSFF